MILTQGRMDRSRIFQAVRFSVQELHPGKQIPEDAHGTPFLFKSADARVWVRIFYRAMQDFSLEELKEEIRKLWLLMPQDAVLYLFYPALDRAQILKMNGFSDRLSFFEYVNLAGTGTEGRAVHICKWVPSVPDVLPPADAPVKVRVPDLAPSRFLQCSRLSAAEIEGLTDLSLSLRRF